MLDLGGKLLSKGSDQSTRGSRHTVGIYGTNAGGDCMPCVYCYDTATTNEQNFQVKTIWCESLSSVCGLYGNTTKENWPSHVSVRKSGFTDEQLFQQIIEVVYL